MNHSNILWVFLGGVLVIALLVKTDLINFKIIPADDASESHTVAKGPKHGPVKTFDKYGNLHTLVNYDHGVKDGLSYIYYTNGRVMLQMPYRSGKREGESIKYFKNGQVYAITPYKNDELTGIRKTYYRNGQLKAEVPYLRSYPGIGLKEYYKDGAIKELPEIHLRKITQNGRSFLTFETPDCNKVQFYTGSLFNNRFLIPDSDYVSLLPMQGERSYLDLSSVESPLNLICDCTTKSGYPFVTRLVYDTDQP